LHHQGQAVAVAEAASEFPQQWVCQWTTAKQLVQHLSAAGAGMC